MITVNRFDTCRQYIVDIPAFACITFTCGSDVVDIGDGDDDDGGCVICHTVQSVLVACLRLMVVIHQLLALLTGIRSLFCML